MAAKKKTPYKSWSKSTPSLLETPIRVVHPWSDYQRNIFSFVKNDIRSLRVKARAGSSKSTTLQESLYSVPEGKSILVLAFNKIIQEHLAPVVPHHVDCVTFHSAGYKAVRAKFGSVTLDNDKVRTIIGRHWKFYDWDTQAELGKVVSFCKSTLATTHQEIVNLIEKYDFDVSPLDENTFVSNVLTILDECKKLTSVIDFDDMLYFVAAHNISPTKYDVIFIDEGNDCTALQIKVALMMLKPEGRFIFFSDPNQAIYGFRGADYDVISEMLNQFNPVELELPICYRCPVSGVKLAQEFVPDIQAAPNAVQGTVSTILLKDLVNHAKPGDFVISRKNAPLIKQCMTFLKAGIPANIKGKDFGNNLSVLVRKSKTKTLDSFFAYLEKWKSKEVAKLVSQRKDFDHITDKHECLMNLSEGCSSLQDLKNNIEKLFGDKDDKKCVLFTNVHKIKGLETENTFLLSNTFRKSNQEEININYIANTRHKLSITFVTKK